MKELHIKKMKIIWTLGLSSLILFSFFITTLIITLMIYQSQNTITNDSVYITFTILSVIGILVAAILSFAGSLIILITDFKNKEINESRILWGLLSLFLLGSVGLIIFSSINKSKLSQKDMPLSSKENNEATNNESLPKDSLEVVNQAFKMLETGAITKEEYDKIKEQNL